MSDVRAATPACPGCGEAIELYQPRIDLPEALLGACPACGGLFQVTPSAGPESPFLVEASVGNMVVAARGDREAGGV